MKKILILGGSHRDIPLIKASQELGYFVITLGNSPYYLGHSYANKKYLIDFNNLKMVKEIFIKEKINYLLPGCGEESYINTLKLAHELKIGNFDKLKTAKLVHNKWKFKEFCLKHNISTPKGFYYDKNFDFNNLKFPIIIKPTNLSGGRGVKIVNNPKELKINIKNSLNLSKEIFLEEVIKGELVAYSIFLKNQKIIYKFQGADISYLNKYLVSTAYKIKLKNEVVTKLDKDIEKLAKALDLVDGMFHLQIIIKNNIPYIIDVTRRIAGDLYPNLIEYCDGIEYSKAVVKSYIGIDLKNELDKKEDNFITRHVVMPSKNGKYKDLYIDKTIKNNIIYRFDILKPEYEIKNYLHTQIAILFIKSDNIIKDIHKIIYPIITDEKI